MSALLVALSPFWTAFWLIFIFLPLLMIWIFGLSDVFRRTDLSGLAKVLWVLAILLFPVFGILIYFIARPIDAPLETWSGYEATSVAEELDLLTDLRDKGTLTEEEFQEQKRRVLEGG